MTSGQQKTPNGLVDFILVSEDSDTQYKGENEDVILKQRAADALVNAGCEVFVQIRDSLADDFALLAVLDGSAIHFDEPR